jgi:hypothetical protein
MNGKVLRHADMKWRQVRRLHGEEGDIHSLVVHTTCNVPSILLEGSTQCIHSPSGHDSAIIHSFSLRGHHSAIIHLLVWTSSYLWISFFTPPLALVHD